MSSIDRSPASWKTNLYKPANFSAIQDADSSNADKMAQDYNDYLNNAPLSKYVPDEARHLEAKKYALSQAKANQREVIDGSSAINLDTPVAGGVNDELNTLARAKLAAERESYKNFTMPDSAASVPATIYKEQAPRYPRGFTQDPLATPKYDPKNFTMRDSGPTDLINREMPVGKYTYKPEVASSTGLKQQLGKGAGAIDGDFRTVSEGGKFYLDEMPTSGANDLRAIVAAEMLKQINPAMANAGDQVDFENRRLKTIDNDRLAQAENKLNSNPTFAKLMPKDLLSLLNEQKGSALDKAKQQNQSYDALSILNGTSVPKPQPYQPKQSMDLLAMLKGEKVDPRMSVNTEPFVSDFGKSLPKDLMGFSQEYIKDNSTPLMMRGVPYTEGSGSAQPQTLATQPPAKAKDKATHSFGSGVNASLQPTQMMADGVNASNSSTERNPADEKSFDYMARLAAEQDSLAQSMKNKNSSDYLDLSGAISVANLMNTDGRKIGQNYKGAPSNAQADRAELSAPNAKMASWDNIQTDNNHKLLQLMNDNRNKELERQKDLQVAMLKGRDDNAMERLKYKLDWDLAHPKAGRGDQAYRTNNDFEKFSTLVNDPTSRKIRGTYTSTIDGADRIRAFVDQMYPPQPNETKEQAIARLNNITNSQIAEVVTAFDRSLKGNVGASTVSSFDHLAPNTLKGKAGKLWESISGDPTPANQGAQVYNMIESLRAEKELNQHKLADTNNRLSVGFEHLKNVDPNRFDRVMKTTDSYPEEKASSAYPKGTIVKQSGKTYVSDGNGGFNEQGGK